MILLSPHTHIDVLLGYETEEGHGQKLIANFCQSLSKPIITMKTISSNYVEFNEVKASVRISQVLAHYGLLETLKKEPNGYAGACSFCGSSGRSFRASDKEVGMFNCFSCGAHGNVLGFVQQKENCSVRDAALKLVEWFNLSSGRSPNQTKPKKKKKSKPKKEKPPKSKKPAQKKGEAKPLGFVLELDPEHEFFDEVGIDSHTIKEFGLGFCGRGVLKGCIAFPVHDLEHQLLGYAGYDLEKHYAEDGSLWRFPKQLDLDRALYNTSRIDPTGEGMLIWSANPLDLVLRWQAGETKIVSLLDGVLTPHHLKILESLV